MIGDHHGGAEFTGESFGDSGGGTWIGDASRLTLGVH